MLILDPSLANHIPDMNFIPELSLVALFTAGNERLIYSDKVKIQ